MMIEVIIGSSLLMHCFKSQVGNGSSAQNLLPYDKISDRISLLVAGLKELMVNLVNGSSAVPVVMLRLWRMLSIFSSKNSQKSLDNCVASMLLGSC